MLLFRQQSRKTSGFSDIIYPESEVAIDPKARELALKARLLRFFALIFAIVGLVMFAILYSQNVQGTFFSSLTNPFVVLIILIPFLPAAVLSWRAGKLEKEYDTKYGKK